MTNEPQDNSAQKSIKQINDQMPPLTREQRDLLGALLGIRKVTSRAA